MLLSALILVAHVHGATPIKSLTVKLKATDGQPIGEAVLTPLKKGVKMTLDITKLPPGEHALHFHEKGVCQGPKFESAGGHYAPTTKGHGFDAAEGHHAGDMANIIVGPDGKAKVEIVNTSVTLTPGPTSLLKAGGTSIVIHEKADDYKSQPAGNAGARIACGEIKDN